LHISRKVIELKFYIFIIFGGRVINTKKQLRSWPKWPQYGGQEIKAIRKVIKSGQLYAASEVSNFESEFSTFQGSKFAIGLGNATQGLHLALAAANIGLGDEVIVTPCSWISSASAVLMQNAVPIFADIEEKTLGIDPLDFERKITERTKAIILVHILGYPAQIEEILEIAHQNNILVIEDASHAPGAEVNGKKLGTFGDIGVFSLHQRKAISTGDGGIICTNNLELATKIKRLRSFGDDDLSYNYRMTEFSATLGRIGLKKLNKENKIRTLAATYLAEALSDQSWVTVRLSEKHQIGVYHAIALEFNLPDTKSIEILNKLIALGVPMRKLFDQLNLHPHFSSNRSPARGYPWKDNTYNGIMKNLKYEELELPIAKKMCNGRILELYAHPGITRRQIDAFVIALKEIYLKLK
jgi:perosamine synthetase